MFWFIISFSNSFTQLDFPFQKHKPIFLRDSHKKTFIFLLDISHLPKSPQRSNPKMPESNIINLFSQNSPQNSKEIQYEDCIPCQVMATAFALSLGAYMQTQHLYPKEVKGKPLTPADWEKTYPKWYRTSMKVTGAGLIMFGLVRGSEHWLWNKTQKKNE